MNTRLGMSVGFAPLYPPYDWIPASAGMTEQVQQDAAEGLGVSPNTLFFPPRMGARGLKKAWQTSPTVFLNSPEMYRR